MGGFALGLWGVGRTTFDLDFLIDKEDLEKVDRIMSSLGYECKIKTENVSQYVSPLRILGEVDFLHAFRETARAMLARAVEKEIFGGSLRIKVLKPEDIIGLKLQAMKNNPARIPSDMEDIKSLLWLYKTSLDWKRIEEYCKILDMTDWYSKLKNSAHEQAT